MPLRESSDRHVARRLGSCSAVYCYEDSALETFRTAERIGIRRFYELPIMYWETVQKLLREEAERHPEWEPTLQATRDSPGKLERKEKGWQTCSRPWSDWVARTLNWWFSAPRSSPSSSTDGITGISPTKRRGPPQE
jgi:hypothetical protein